MNIISSHINQAGIRKQISIYSSEDFVLYHYCSGVPNIRMGLACRVGGLISLWGEMGLPKIYLNKLLAIISHDFNHFLVNCYSMHGIGKMLTM